MSLRRPVAAVLRTAEADPPRTLLVDDAPWTPPSVCPPGAAGSDEAAERCQGSVFFPLPETPTRPAARDLGRDVVGVRLDDGAVGQALQQCPQRRIAARLLQLDDTRQVPVQDREAAVQAALATVVPARRGAHEVLVKVSELFHFFGQSASDLGKPNNPVDARAALEANEAFGIHGGIEIDHTPQGELSVQALDRSLDRSRGRRQVASERLRPARCRAREAHPARLRHALEGRGQGRTFEGPLVGRVHALGNAHSNGIAQIIATHLEDLVAGFGREPTTQSPAKSMPENSRTATAMGCHDR